MQDLSISKIEICHIKGNVPPCSRNALCIAPVLDIYDITKTQSADNAHSHVPHTKDNIRYGIMTCTILIYYLFILITHI